MNAKFVRERERRELTGVPISTWYRWMANGDAPKPVNIGPKAVAWLDTELSDWQSKRIAKRDADNSK